MISVSASTNSATRRMGDGSLFDFFMTVVDGPEFSRILRKNDDTK
jgi:hypothetical protein